MKVRFIKKCTDTPTKRMMEIGDVIDVDDERGCLLIEKGYAAEEVTRIPIFLSYPRPHQKTQAKFLDAMKKDLLNKTNLYPRTLGVTDFYQEPPLIAISKIMSECCGLLIVALKQTLIVRGEFRANGDNDLESFSIENKWITSPFCHVEPAMALQISLPVFILRDKDVIQDGVLDNGVVGAYISKVDLSSSANDYFQSQEWNQLLEKWAAQVREFAEKRESEL